jgi:hypothetical protein
MRDFVAVLFISPILFAASVEASGFLPKEDMEFLEGLAAAVVQESRVYPDAKVGDVGPNTTGGALIRPGGRACYPAFWIRDYAMSLESGLITEKEQRHALLLTAEKQQNEPWSLPNGSFVPRGSVPDHISFGGKPIFYAGALEDYEGQGGPQWGKLPCLDDHFFFIHMAGRYVYVTGDVGALKLMVNGESLLGRLERAFLVPPSRKDTGLVYASAEERGVTFGFVDTITHTGDLLFCSLLKYGAATELAWLYAKVVDPERVTHYGDVARTLKKAIPAAFATEKGFLRASTGKSAQADVWGTAFAVYIAALDPAHERAACEALARAFLEGRIAWRGNIRHVPTSDDFSDTSAWEVALGPKNRYQNGAYWGTPTGWVCYAIAKVNIDLARKLAAEYIAELREGDFRKGPDFGSPWECMHPEGNHRQNPVYMTSVTCPLAAFRRIENELQTPASSAIRGEPPVLESDRK